MNPVAKRPARSDVGTILILVAIALWALTLAWMRLPEYLFGAEGQLYALFPVAALTELAVVVLAIAAAVFAIVEAARRRTSILRPFLVSAGSLLMLTVGPVLIWFGTIPGW